MRSNLVASMLIDPVEAKFRNFERAVTADPTFTPELKAKLQDFSSSFIHCARACVFHIGKFINHSQEASIDKRRDEQVLQRLKIDAATHAKVAQIYLRIATLEGLDLASNIKRVHTDSVPFKKED